MYAALWRALPGPLVVRLLLALLLVAAVIVVCFEWVFPWVNDLTPDPSGTVGEAAAAGAVD